MKLLFCQLRNHGDIIRTFPLLDAIKHHHPDWEIGYTCYPDMEEVCQLSPCIDRLFLQPRLVAATDSEGGTRLLNCSPLNDCIHAIRQEKYDIYVDLHGIFQSALVGLLCHIPTRLGRSQETAKDGAHMFYTDHCPIREREINRMERHFRVISTLFEDIRPIPSGASEGNHIILFPGSSAHGILKRWGTVKYTELAQLLASILPVRIILGPDERELIEQFPPSDDVEIIHISHWRELLGLFHDCKLVIGNDIAYTHMAIWKQIPSVMICGPLSAQINGVWSYGPGKTIYAKSGCSCTNPWAGECTNGHHCMKSIDVPEVLDAACKYLSHEYSFPKN